MRKQVIAITAAMFVVACNGNNFLRLDAVGNKDLQDITHSIVEDFNNKIGCNLWSISSSTMKLSKDLTIERRAVRIFHSTKNVREADDKAWGLFDFYNNEISIIEELDFPTWKEGIKFVLLHELGHAMGLAHEENTIMNEKYKFMPYPIAMQSLIDLLNKHHKNQCWQINKED